MPSWKKIITSGSSDASLGALFVTNAVTSSIFSGSRFIGASFTGSYTGSLSGSLFGTSSFATTASFAISSSRSDTSSFALTSSFISTTGTNAFVQGGNSFGAAALIGTNDNQNFAIETNGSTKVTVDTSGNVGIGATSPLARLHAGPNISDTSDYSFTNTGAVIASFGVDHTATRTNVLSLMRDGTSGVVYAGLAAFDLSRWSADGVNARTQLDIRLANTDTNTITDVISLRSNGNVGIGTTSPTGSLQVNGILSISNNAVIGQGNAYGTIGAANFTTLKLYDSSTGDTVLNNQGYNIQLQTAGSSKLTIANGGNVGIGTTTPGQKLDVIGRLRFRSDTSTSPGFWLTDNAATEDVFVGLQSTTSTSAFGVYSAGSWRFTILNGGNVGIGTTSPAYKLDVDGTFRSTTSVIGDYTSYGFAINTPTANFGNARNYIRLHTTSVSARIVSFKIRISTTWSWVPGFGYIDADVSYYFDGSILSYPSVNVTSATGQALNSISLGDLVIEGGYVSLPVYITNSNSLYIKTEGSPSFDYSLITTSGWSSVSFPGSNIVKVPGSFYVDGNVGIGTTPTSAKLKIAGTTDSLVFDAYSEGFNGSYALLPGRTSVGTIGSGYPDFGYNFTTTGGVYTKIGNDTAWGIGLGGGNYMGFKYAAAGTGTFSWNTAMVINLSGNVGIGTTSPYEKLEVAGAVSATGASAGLSAQGTATTISVESGVGYLRSVDWGAEYKSLVIEGQNISMQTGVGSTTSRITINSSGDVGIGTASPNAKLDIASSTTGTTMIVGRYSGYPNIKANTDAGGYLILDSNGNAAGINHYVSDNVWLATGGGFVGVGTTSPNARLDVVGGINSRNTRVDATKKYPIGHYSSGETVFEIDPTWTQAQLQDYFGSTGFTWNTDSTAPGGYSIQVDGALNVGNVVYSSGFPFIPVDTGSNDWYYMECWIRNEAGSVNNHYMGGIDYDASFGNLGGNPGSYTYNVMLNYNPGTTWTKVFGYWNGYGSSSGGSGTGNTNNWVNNTKYFGPQALFNYSNSSGTRRCYISGWRLIKVNNPGNRYFQNNVLVNGDAGIGTTSPAYKLDVLGTIRATGDVIAYSDARVKDNVEPIENALEKVISLRGVSYTRKDIDDKSPKIGVIAQEVLPIIPEVVSKDQNGNYSVSYGNMVGLLIEAVKEQQKQIDELKYLLENKKKKK
jgi:hypothetical protein